MRRCSLVEEAFPNDLRDQFAIVVYFCRDARNHMVHGPAGTLGWRFLQISVPNIDFYVRGGKTSEVWCGSDELWSQGLNLAFHPFAGYVRNFKTMKRGFEGRLGLKSCTSSNTKIDR